MKFFHLNYLMLCLRLIETKLDLAYLNQLAQQATVLGLARITNRFPISFLGTIAFSLLSKAMPQIVRNSQTRSAFATRMKLEASAIAEIVSLISGK